MPSFDQDICSRQGAEQSARQEGSDFELALTLTALLRLDELQGSTASVEQLQERDEILKRLDVVRIPELEAAGPEERTTWVAPA